MNQRIQKLVEQVYGTAATEQEIRLAQLIVLECADVIHKRVGPISALSLLAHFGVEGEEVDFYKKHFGVEE